jgi:hypothetical protein
MIDIMKMDGSLGTVESNSDSRHRVGEGVKLNTSLVVGRRREENRGGRKVSKILVVPSR